MTLANDVLDLPHLREDIQLLAGPTTPEGRPTWAIFDPVRNRYFRIGWEAFQLLSRWAVGSSEQLLERTRRETTCDVDEDDIKSLVNFLYTSNLTVQSASGQTADYIDQFEAAKPGWFSWLMRNYLFLRFPLVRPDPFLRKLAVLADPLFSRMARNLLLFIGVLGIFLVSRQWESFTNTFLYFYSAEGVIFYVLGLVFVKICHELGHALTATRFGCRVASMGVAFLVFFPVLYTDTTDAYRLTSRKRRLYVSAAGILTEFYLALICIFLWNLLPDGVLRSVVFVLGTISFTLTVLININPFLRFDGYYFLADWLGLENLQARSFAIGRWKLRQLIFGIHEQPPEKFSPKMERFLYWFAWATWTYRFLLLSAIAAIVYAFFFKLLGLILFLGVLYTFLWQPVMKEVMDWWEKREQISSRRGLMLGSIVILFLAAVLIPWRSTISLPALLAPGMTATVYSPGPGRIESTAVTIGMPVNDEQVLVRLSSPSLEEDLERTETEIKLLRLRLQRIAASAEDLGNLQVLTQSLQEKETRVDVLRGMKDRLSVRSPISGTVVEVAESLHPGRWINESLPIAYVIDTTQFAIDAVVQESDLARVAIDQAAKFVPDDATIASIPATVVAIDKTNLSDLDLPYLASVYGGDVAVREDSQRGLVPETSVYRLRLSASLQTPVADRVLRGVAQVKGHPKSFAERVYEVVAAAIVRGSAF